MSSSYHFGIKEPDNPQELYTFTLATARTLIWRKAGGEMAANKYAVWCSNCNRCELVDKNTLEHIKAADRCPFCHMTVRVKRTDHLDVKDYVRVPNDEFYDDGYEVYAHYELGGKIEGYHYHCYHRDEKNKEYVRGIIKTMYCTLGVWNRYEFVNGRPVERTDWRLIRPNFYGSNTYGAAFYNMSKPEILTRKQYYTELVKDITLKSNQIELLKKNLYSLDQVRAIKIFDLKTDAEVMKYKKYIKAMYTHCNEQLFNITTLDYLSRNNIVFSDYLDYRSQCKELGIKLDKPKNFAEAHSNLSKELTARHNQQLSDSIAKRLNDVIKFEYKHKQYEVKAFEDYSNLLTVATTLHNCMASNFSKPYAEGITDIFYGTHNGQVVCGIEVKNGKLLQLRADYNRDVDNSCKRFVHKWCRKMGIAYA